jgi:hypothetical protein
MTRTRPCASIRRYWALPRRPISVLHKQARSLLVYGGLYLVCDHFVGEGGMTNDQLYMTVEEQKDALFAAGFTQVSEVLLKGGLVLQLALD